MIRFNDILKEQVDPQGVFSPIYTRSKTFTDAEEEFLKTGYEYTPNYFGVQFPPAQVQWQWKEEREKGSITYGVVLTKEIEHDNPRSVGYEDPENIRRYKVVVVSINNANGQTGMIEDYCRVSNTFKGIDDIEELDRFLDSLEYLQDNYTEEIDAPTHFGSVNGYLI
jgi:hypothetical protein